MLDVPIRLQSQTAKMPTRGSDHAAGMDFYADLGFGEVVKLFPGRRALISLGVAMAIPVGYWLGLEPRSGLAYKNGIMVMGGVIDADYRDTVYALLHNSGDTTLDITHGMKIIQGVLKPVFEADWFQVDTLPDTARGNGGFGSTGV